MTLRH